MNFLSVVLFVLGLGLLILGAEFLVRGASRLASLARISPLIIGLTVVAFGTSSPEMAVSIHSALAGKADIALGNIVGSNIFNVLFILGISGIITPLVVTQQLVRLDVPIMIAVSVLTLFFGFNGRIGRLEGIFLCMGICAYTGFLFYKSHQQKRKQLDGGRSAGRWRKDSNLPWLSNSGLIAGGLVLLVLGSRWLVKGAVGISKAVGVSELVIGLTVVAAGTSLPEVATSVMASIRRERDIAVGNIIGSNIFNILAVLGAAAVVAPDGIAVSPAALDFDIPVMIAVAVACLPIFFSGQIIARWEAVVFLGYYLAYALYLMLSSTHHDMLPMFSSIMIIFVIPLTVLTLLIVTLRSIRVSFKK